jgi:hypothetical protein
MKAPLFPEVIPLVVGLIDAKDLLFHEFKATADPSAKPGPSG